MSEGSPQAQIQLRTQVIAQEIQRKVPDQVAHAGRASLKFSRDLRFLGDHDDKPG